MQALQIIGGILCIVLFVFGIYWLTKRIKRLFYEKFKFNIFSLKIIILESLAILFMWIGYFWYDYELTHSGDTLNGIVFIVLSLLIILGIIVHIYKKTDIKYGTLGTLILLIKLSILGILVPLYIAYLIGIYVGSYLEKNAVYYTPY